MSATRLPHRIYAGDIALDIHFNAAVLTICNRMLPGGFDVAAAASKTYEQLIAHLGTGARMLVYSGGSERTIPK